jgi:hypothetical protein
VRPLARRIDRLEGARPRSSPYDAMDPILAEMSMPDLITLLQHGDNVRHGLRPTEQQRAVHKQFRDRLAAVGIVLP